MDYFAAVQEGRARARRATQVLNEIAGASYSVLFMKIGMTDWTPVGEENLYSVVPGDDGKATLVICDRDGNAKAMSSWKGLDETERLAAILESRGLQRYQGEVKLSL